VGHKDIKDITYIVETIAFKAAFLFFGVTELTNFKAADLTRLVRDDNLFFAVLRPVVVRFFVVVLPLTVDFFLLLNSAILLMI